MLQRVCDVGPRKKYDSDDLLCLCAICSAEIFIRLSEKGYSPVFCEIEDEDCCVGHCYVVCNGYLVDVTAMQFNHDLPKVSVFKKPTSENSADGLWFWGTPHRTAKTVSGIKRLTKEWPSDQRPFEEGED